MEAIYHYVATVIELDSDGQANGEILHADTPEGLRDEIVRYLETERNDRDLDIDTGGEAILTACRFGNTTSGPERIEDVESGVEFLIYAKRIAIKL